MKDYGHLLADDPEWGERAARFSASVRDVHEVLADLLAEARAREPHRDWRNILDSGILDDIRAGRIAEARERLQL
jgi:hypothetical protein